MKSGGIFGIVIGLVMVGVIVAVASFAWHKAS
jgi:hypothetical protein